MRQGMTSALALGLGLIAIVGSGRASDAPWSLPDEARGSRVAPLFLLHQLRNRPEAGKPGVFGRCSTRQVAPFQHHDAPRWPALFQVKGGRQPHQPGSNNGHIGGAEKRLLFPVGDVEGAWHGTR